MKNFQDENGAAWVADVREEDTPRHHGRFYLVLHPADRPDDALPVPEIRWQTAASAARTLDTIAEFELRRRLIAARDRLGARAVQRG